MNLKRFKVGAPLVIYVGIALLSVGMVFYVQETRRRDAVKEQVRLSEELEILKNEDQYKINEELEGRIGNIETAYDDLSKLYEQVADLDDEVGGVDELEEKLAVALSQLSDRDYEAAIKTMEEIESGIAEIRNKQERERLAVVAEQQQESLETVTAINQPPDSGYRSQVVDTEIGRYTVSLVAADVGSTKVIVDTASTGDCANDCPVLPLGEYVARNGAYAGINGSYFCPASYPSCAGKTNSFDLLLMNKDKVYFNSDNNVYSGNPGVIFGNGYVRFVSSVSQWGRDTGIDSMISNFPLLVYGNQITFAGDGDPKKGSKAGRSFVANQGSKVYIGVVHNATVAESAIVLKTLGMENAMNLDSGGSTALWSGGYKVGPGRNLPNVVLFVSR